MSLQVVAKQTMHRHSRRHQSVVAVQLIQHRCPASASSSSPHNEKIVRHPLQYHRHHLYSTTTSSQLPSSSSSGNADITIAAPSPATKSWERSAKLVKNTTINNKYLEHIRDVHDPSQHVKTIEDELRGTMGKALGKQGLKVETELNVMKKERTKYDALVRRYHELWKDGTHKREMGVLQNEIEAHVKRYNDARSRATKARWELLVHRQAVGFTVGNHNIVHKMFPIKDALPLDVPDPASSSGKDEEADNEKGEVKQKVVFGDQLDWWQRVGRWR